MNKGAFIFHIVWLLVAVMISPLPVLAKTEYTYVKASLVYPWFMFFVFLVLVMIPFLTIMVLSWRKQSIIEENEQSQGE